MAAGAPEDPPVLHAAGGAALCYSTDQQPAHPIITALGKQLPERQIDIDRVSLVIQNGPERDGNWTTVGTIRLHATALA